MVFDEMANFGQELLHCFIREDAMTERHGTNH